MPFVFRTLIGAACALFVHASFAQLGGSGLDNLPSLGEAGSADLSMGDERKLGELIMRDYRVFGAVTTDPEISAYLNALGGKIVRAAGESPSSFEFFLVADPSINAFALPGGFIGVHTGLIAAARSEGELASVLSHEVGHVTQRHIARMYGQQKQTSLVSTAAMIAAILVASSNPQAASGLAAAGAGYQLEKQLGFSRDAEREADRIGYNTLVQAGYPPQNMVTFFGRLQQSSRLYENNAPAYLRTHPLTSERIADIRNRTGLEANENINVFQTPPASLEYELLRVKSLVYSDKTPQQLQDRMKSLNSSLSLDQLDLNHPLAIAYGKALVLEKMKRPQEALDTLLQGIAVATQSVKSAGVSVNRADQPAMLQNLQMELRITLADVSINQGKDNLNVRSESQLGETERAFLKELQTYLSVAGGALYSKTLYARGLQTLGLYGESGDYLRNLSTIYRSSPEVFELLAKNSLATGRRAEHHFFVAQAYASRGAYLPAIEQTQIARRLAADDYYLSAQIESKEREYKIRAQDERKFVQGFE